MHTPRQYITDLNRNSSALESINDEFRHISRALKIVSFYETLPTKLQGKKMVIIYTVVLWIFAVLITVKMIVEKDSAILGYPNEIAIAVTADHHTICKFLSREDLNYISFRNILKSLVDKFRRKGMSCPRDSGVHSQHYNVSYLEGLSANSNLY